MSHSFSKAKIILLFFIQVIFFAACKRDDVKPPDPILPPPNPAPVITSILKPVTTYIDNSIGGYYVALPSNYNQTTEKYPVLIYIPGAGQFGNGSIDLPLLLKDGPAQLVDEKRFPGTFNVNGKTFSLIVFTPQLKYWPSTFAIDQCINYVKNNYRIDSTRIYLSGLSAGSILICDAASDYPGKFAAIVPMAGVSSDYAFNNKCQVIANNNLPVWAFHSADDAFINVSLPQGYVAKINSFNPAVPAKLTVWPNGGHDAWTRAIEPNYKRDGLNIYEWMLQYHK